MVVRLKSLMGNKDMVEVHVMFLKFFFYKFWIILPN